MEVNIYHIDAFSEGAFRGNPACVVPLAKWLPDDVLLNIAKENAVPETAFFIVGQERFPLRWFTPDIEMDLCGHATLATAHVIKTILNHKSDSIIFDSVSGVLAVNCHQDLYYLDFPSRKPVAAALPEVIRESLNIQPVEVLKSRDYILVYEHEQQIRDINLDRPTFDKINLDPGGLVVTAKGERADFVSRYFTPQASILEDPVTGSAHCSLIPYWSEQLNRKELTAIQLSERAGILYCEDKGDRVIIGGKAKTSATGTIHVELPQSDHAASN